MHKHTMKAFLAMTAFTTVTLAVAQAPVAPAPHAPASPPGFFKPAADPALTKIPPPAPAATPAAVTPPTLADLARARERRAADEAAMDRVEALHSRALAATPPKAPVITSPLDGTAPVMSPLDGTAPIVSPVGR